MKMTNTEKIKRELRFANCFITNDIERVNNRTAVNVNLFNSFYLIATSNAKLERLLHKICRTTITINNKKYFKFRLPQKQENEELRNRTMDVFNNSNITYFKFLTINPTDKIRTYTRPKEKKTQEKTFDATRSYISKLDYIERESKKNENYCYEIEDAQKPNNFFCAIQRLPDTKYPILFLSIPTMYIYTILTHIMLATKVQFQAERENTNFNVVAIDFKVFKNLFPLSLQRKINDVLDDAVKKPILSKFELKNNTLFLSYADSFLRRYKQSSPNFTGFVKFPVAFILEALKSDNLTKNGFIFFSFILRRLMNNNSRITHSLTTLLKVCEISTQHSKADALKRLNKYFKYLEKWGVVKDYTDLTRADFKKSNLNIRIYQPKKFKIK